MNCHNNSCAVSVGNIYAALSGTENSTNPYCTDAVPLGKFFVNMTVDKTVVEVVNPEVNTHGLIIRTCAFSGEPTTSGLLYADVAPPAVFNDDTKKVAFHATVPPTCSMKYPLHVSPGNGLWYATSNKGYINMTFDLVDPEKI